MSRENSHGHVWILCVYVFQVPLMHYSLQNKATYVCSYYVLGVNCFLLPLAIASA